MRAKQRGKRSSVHDGHQRGTGANGSKSRIRLPVISRSDARKLGLKRYVSKLPCKYGHVEERFVSTGACLQCHRNRQAKWTRENKTLRNERRRDAYRRDPKLKIQYAKYRVQQMQNENFRLATRLRSDLHCAIKRNWRTGSFIDGLGCTIDQLRLYLEQQFTPKMKWSNWGIVWQIDHIRTLALFDLRKRNQFLKACHYTNIRPLLVAEHKRKSTTEKFLRHQT